MSEQVRSIALVDCNNFYVSCERLFRPDLQGKPVVVLSNNDGCVVSRSNEVKAFGVKIGAPIFEIDDLVKRHRITIFSSNYALYADISNRVMSVLSEFSPTREIYSIDETFLDLTGFTEINERVIRIREQVQQQVGMPVCVGIGRTKTLAKLANFVAKRHPKSTGVFNFNRLTEIQTQRMMTQIPINEIWGVGRQLSKALLALDIHSVEQLRTVDVASMRKRFGVVFEKIIRELRGKSCIELEEVSPAKKQIINSRSFGHSVTEITDLEDAITHFISNAAKKCRDQQSIANVLHVFLQTNRFRDDQAQYSPTVTIPLITPTSDTMVLTRWALKGLQSIYKTGYQYKRAGVMLSELMSEKNYQGDLFSSHGGNPALMKVMDKINTRYGKGTLKLSQDGYQNHWKMRQENKSPEYTTNWNDLPICH